MNPRTAPRFFFTAILLGQLVVATLLGGVLTASATSQVGTQRLLAVRYLDELLEVGNGSGSSFLLTDDAVLTTPEGTFMGPDGANDYGTLMNGAFSNLEFQVQQINVEDGSLTMPFTLTGIHVSTFAGLPGKCGAIAIQGLAVLSFNENTVDRQWITYDRDALVGQIRAFNDIEPTRRPSCAEQLGSQPLEMPAPQLPPACLPAQLCELPF